MRSPGHSHRGRLARLKAFLLLAVFLTAGTSLPSFDALAIHTQNSESERSRPHVEPAGGCASHGDHCTLGRTASGSGAVATLGDGTRYEPVTQPANQRSPQLQPTCADPGALPRTRAPPSLRYV
jgi:hypothetical protein